MQKGVGIASQNFNKLKHYKTKKQKLYKGKTGKTDQRCEILLFLSWWWCVKCI